MFRFILFPYFRSFFSWSCLCSCVLVPGTLALHLFMPRIRDNFCLQSCSVSQSVTTSLVSLTSFSKPTDPGAFFRFPQQPISTVADIVSRYLPVPAVPTEPMTSRPASLRRFSPLPPNSTTIVHHVAPSTTMYVASGYRPLSSTPCTVLAESTVTPGDAGNSGTIGPSASFERRDPPSVTAYPGDTDL